MFSVSEDHNDTRTGWIEGSIIPRKGEMPLFVTSCPYYLIHKSPSIGEISRAYDWFEKGQLHLLYPNGVTCLFIERMNNYKAGIAAGTKERLDSIKSK